MATDGVGLEGVQEVREVGVEDLLAAGPIQIFDDAGVAGDPPQIDERRRRPDVGSGQRERLVHAADDMTDVDAEIPERIEQALRDRADAGILRIITDEQDVHIGVEAHDAPAIAPYRDQRDPPLGSVPRGLSRGVGGAVERAQQPVQDPRVASRRVDALGPTPHRVDEGRTVPAEVAAAGASEARGELSEVDGGVCGAFGHGRGVWGPVTGAASCRHH